MKESLQLPNEVQKIINEVLEKEEQEFKDIIEEVKQERKGQWDIKDDDIIEFFDPLLSYQKTGYKPITEEKSLDFNPDWFTEARDTFLRTGHYTQFRKGTLAYKKFWDQQYIYCRDGMTKNGYTITGHNYFFLNFYQMPSTETDKAGTSRGMIFPKFLVYQYEFFHYFELCKILRKNICMMKSRGIGFSEITASILANQYNSFRKSNSLLTASTDNYVKDTLAKIWDALTFLNDNTDGGFRKLTQVVNTAYQKRASCYKKVDGQDIEVGWKSQITGVVADDDSKIRGKRVDLLVLEEAGHNKNLRKSFIKGEALCYIGGTKFGLIIAGGTGGDKDVNMDGLMDIYYNPETYDVLPFRHNFTQTGDDTLSGFFIPCFKALYKQDFIDNRGFCNSKKAKEWYDLERGKRIGSPQGLMDYCSEYCYNAEEAFMQSSNNIFNKTIIAEQLTKIRALKIGPEVERGNFRFLYKNNNNKKFEGGNIQDIIWQKVTEGKILILEHPMWEMPLKKDPKSGEILFQPIPRTSNLYVAGVDGIDIGQDQTSDDTKNPSDFCMVIKKRVFGMQHPKYVCIYKDRPGQIHEAYKIAIALAMYYNCSINIEATRLSFLTWARSNLFLNYFMRRPSATYQDITKRKSGAFGTPATTQVIQHQNQLIADFIEEYGEDFWFEEALEQLSKYSVEKKRLFDIVVAMGMAELADEEMTGVTPRTSQKVDDSFEDFGYYYDENGIKRFGVIPKQESFETKFNFNSIYDYGQVKTSNPRYYF